MDFPGGSGRRIASGSGFPSRWKRRPRRCPKRGARCGRCRCCGCSSPWKWLARLPPCVLCSAASRDLWGWESSRLAWWCQGSSASREGRGVWDGATTEWGVRFRETRESEPATRGRAGRRRARTRRARRARVTSRAMKVARRHRVSPVVCTLLEASCPEGTQVRRPRRFVLSAWSVFAFGNTFGPLSLPPARSGP